jgi:PAS domain S-box-containing protein
MIPFTRSLVMGLVFLGATWSAFETARDLTVRRGALEQRIVEDLKIDLSVTQNHVEMALAADNEALVQRQFYLRGSDPSLEVLVYADAAGTIVAAHRREDVGRTLGQVLKSALDAGQMAEVQASRSARVWVAPDRVHVVGVYPIALPTGGSVLRPASGGEMIAVYDMSAQIEALRRLVFRDAVQFVGGLAAVLTAVALVGEYGIARRARAIVTMTERFADGNDTARVHPRGWDELAIVGRAVDAMADRLVASRQARERTEENFRALVQSSPVAIVLTDEGGRVRANNPAWEALTGSTGWVGRTWFEALHHDDAQSARATWELSAEGGGSMSGDWRVVRPDGGTAWTYAARSQRLEGPEGPGFLCTVLDTTERRRAEQDRLVASLRDSNRLEALGVLASGVAHDFNNTLAIVLGNASALRAETQDAEARSAAEQIVAAAERGRDLVRRILAFGRPGEGARLRVEAAALLDEATTLLRASLPPSVRLHVHAAPDAPAVMGDPVQLQQVLVHLATNGAQAMEPRGGKLSLEALRSRLQGGPALCLRVTDEGHGMESSTLARAFDPFFTTRPPGESSGLGLAVVHNIVAGLGGVVRLRSEPGQGTTAEVLLPAAEPAVPAPEAPRPAGVRPARGGRVVLVDDEEPLLALQTRAFTRAGFQVQAFTDPRKALAHVQEHAREVDLVVTDQRMPEMLGEELLAACLRVRADLPVVVSSGHVTPADAARIRSRGARAVLEKPMSVEQILEACAEVLEEVHV